MPKYLFTYSLPDAKDGDHDLLRKNLSANFGFVPGTTETTFWHGTASTNIQDLEIALTRLLAGIADTLGIKTIQVDLSGHGDVTSFTIAPGLEFEPATEAERIKFVTAVTYDF